MEGISLHPRLKPITKSRLRDQGGFESFPDATYRDPVLLERVLRVANNAVRPPLPMREEYSLADLWLRLSGPTEHAGSAYEAWVQGGFHSDCPPFALPSTIRWSTAMEFNDVDRILWDQQLIDFMSLLGTAQGCLPAEGRPDGKSAIGNDIVIFGEKILRQMGSIIVERNRLMARYIRLLEIISVYDSFMDDF